MVKFKCFLFSCVHFLFFSTMCMYHLKILLPFLLLSIQCNFGQEEQAYSSGLSWTWRSSLTAKVLRFFKKLFHEIKFDIIRHLIFSEYGRLQTIFTSFFHSENHLMTLYHFEFEFLLWSKNSPKMKDLQVSWEQQKILNH
jgi:hypothetical protein